MADETLTMPDLVIPEDGDAPDFVAPPSFDDPGAADRPDNVVPFPVDEIVDYRVEFGGETFEIDEPDIDTIFRVCNVLGELWMRSTQVVGLNLKGLFTAWVEQIVGGSMKRTPQSAVPLEANIAGLLVVAKPKDFEKLAIAVLFGGDDESQKRGEQFMKRLDRKQIKVAPVMRALAWRIRQSDDLREALGNLELVQSAVAIWTTRRPKT